jgi:ribosomal protein L32
VFVLVALGIQREMRMCHIVICAPTESTVFFHNISSKAGFSKRKKVTEL